MPFPRCARSPRREAPRTLRERLECSEGGNTGRRTRRSYRVSSHSRPFSPRPGRAECGIIRARPGKASGSSSVRWGGGGLDQLREPHRKGYTFAHLRVASAGGPGRLALPLQAAEQGFETLLQKLLPERGIAPRAVEFGLGDRRVWVHRSELVTGILTMRPLVYRDYRLPVVALLPDVTLTPP